MLNGSHMNAHRILHLVFAAFIKVGHIKLLYKVLGKPLVSIRNAYNVSIKE